MENKKIFSGVNTLLRRVIEKENKLNIKVSQITENFKALNEQALDCQDKLEEADRNFVQF